MKKTLLPTGLLCAILISGCATQASRMPCISKSSQVELIYDSAVKKEPGKEKTTLIREIIVPDKYASGNNVIVKICIVPASQISAVILEEVVPEGWEVVKSDPKWNKRYGDKYTWLFWGKTLALVEVEYELKLPENIQETVTFKGSGKTFKEGTLPVTGAQSIKIK